ncbi:hypothetical protein HNV12_06550 [Methanococcoides sp. SA1]|nr:hypothetical protein [Methanococcoides sp. SA1]
MKIDKRDLKEKANNNRWPLLLFAVVILFSSGSMSMLTGSSTVQVQPGETVEIPISFTHDYSFFYEKCQFRVMQDQQSFGNDGSDGTRIWSNVVPYGEDRSFVASYTVPSTPGTYNVDYNLEGYTGRWTGCGSFRMTFEVLEALPEPTPEPEQPITQPEVPDEQDLKAQVEPVVLNGTMFDKIMMVFNLAISWISGVISV